MKKYILLFLLALPIIVKAQYTNTFVIGPGITPTVNYIYLGSLTLSTTNSSNAQKIQVDILGKGFGSTDVGVTTFTIANRNGITVNEITEGGAGIDATFLKVYSNGANTDFWLYVPTSTLFYSLSVKSWLFGLSLAGQMVTITGQSGTPTGTDITSTVTVNPMFVTDASGNISVNTLSNHNFKLAVNGNVIANAVTIQAYANWPDYVFNKDYKLPELSRVKGYLNTNHHLPDMPSAATIADKGLNVGEVDQALTKKVEELTLYAIQQNELIRSQQKQIDQLAKSIVQLKKGAKANNKKK